MGDHHNTEIGYGVLVLNDDNDGEQPDFRIEMGSLQWEMVGDNCLAEDEGLFFMSKSVVIDTSSGGQFLAAEWVERYSKFNVSPEISQEVDDLAARLIADGFIVKVGAFKVSNYG